MINKEKIYCSACGKLFDQWDTQNHFSLSHKSIGYGSRYDMSSISAPHLCNDCFDSILDVLVKRGLQLKEENF